MPKERNKADSYREKAYEGDTKAMNNLGVCYERGTGVKVSLELAFEWYMKAAELGDVYGCFNVGECYYHGKGVEQDAVKAFEWYMKAADKGDVQSQVNVANAYYLGDGVEQDHHKAFLWYREAAFHGHVQSQKNCGAAYWNGDGVEKNLEECAFWYELAANGGDAQAQFAIKAISPRLTIVRSMDINGIKGMITIDTTNMCSHLQSKLFEEDGIYHSLWIAMQDDPELTAVVRSRQLHIYRNGKKVLVLAGKSAPKVIREDSICELLQIERIKWMEQRFNNALAAIKDGSADSLKAIKEDVAELSKYYGSKLWKQDFAADEAGILPPDLKRGVLSEDGIWNLLSDYRDVQKKK